jgi:alkylation response protein AidB-like acyl-CoA dehydrogenase
MSAPTQPGTGPDSGTQPGGTQPGGGTGPGQERGSGSGAQPDLLYTDIEEDLRSTVRDVLADRCPPASLPARVEAAAEGAADGGPADGGPADGGPADGRSAEPSARPYDPALWRVLGADLGLAGLLVPEKLGGQGASAREAAVVLEELGAGVAPTPFLGSAVLATSALLACDTADAGVAALLGSLASGAATGALAVPLAAAPGGAFPGAVRADAAGRLTGTVTSVADALAADVLVVPAVGPDGPGLYEVAAGDAAVTPFVSLDLTRPLADVAFDGAAARPLPSADAAAALDAALLAGAGLLASEQLGVAQWCLDETVRYLGERHQFGRVVGGFQAIKHRLADLWLEVVSLRAAARSAADALATGTDAAIAVRVAQAYASGVAVHAAEEAVQLHGGIGMTWEHPLHLYLKRAKADQIALGTAGRHRAALAPLLDLPAA